MIDSTALSQSLMEKNEMQVSSSPPSGLRVHGNTASSAPARPDHTTVEMGGCASIAVELTQCGHDEHASELHPDDTRMMFEGVDQELKAVVTTETRGNATADEIALTVKHLIQGDFDAARAAATPGSPAEYVVLNMPTELPENTDSSPSATMQRAQTIIDSLGELLAKLGRNEFEGNLGRWASNLTISGMRTGLVIGTLTAVRQLIGFALEKSLFTNAAAPLTRNVLSAIALSIGPALNILGAIRDECNGTANQQTRLARVATLTLSMAALALTASAPAAAMPALAAYGTQMAFYSFANDLVNLFLPITDNSKANLGGTAASGVLNGALQFLAFTGMNYTAPHSGPGYVMSQGKEPPPSEPQTFAAQLSVWLAQNTDTASDPNPAVQSRANEIVESLALVVGHDFLRGAYNAGADVASQVIGGELMHTLQGENTGKGLRINLSARVPTAEQVANQFLSTNAIRTSVSETIIAVVISATRYFSTLPISNAEVDHIVNTLVAAVVFAGRFGGVYVNERTTPA